MALLERGWSMMIGLRVTPGSEGTVSYARTASRMGTLRCTGKRVQVTSMAPGVLCAVYRAYCVCTTSSNVLITDNEYSCLVWCYCQQSVTTIDCPYVSQKPPSPSHPPSHPPRPSHPPQSTWDIAPAPSQPDPSVRQPHPAPPDPRI